MCGGTSSGLNNLIVHTTRPNTHKGTFIVLPVGQDSCVRSGNKWHVNEDKAPASP